MKTRRFEELKRRTERGHWLTPAEARELIIHADVMESCARSLDDKQPFCEHENRYAFTDDGGKTGKCVMCENANLDALARDLVRTLELVIADPIAPVVTLSLAKAKLRVRKARTILGPDSGGTGRGECHQVATSSVNVG